MSAVRATTGLHWTTGRADRTARPSVAWIDNGMEHKLRLAPDFRAGCLAHRVGGRAQDPPGLGHTPPGMATAPRVGRVPA